jgi:MFS family permease
MVMLIYLFLGYFVFTIYVHLLPHITDLGISATTATNILAVYGILNATGCIVLGGIADRVGSRQVITISFILITIALFWLVPIREIWMLYLFAVIQGLGGGGTAPTESTVVAELFGMKSHGSIFGFVSCSFTIGSAIGPLLAGYLFDITSSYQAAFIICAVAGAVGLILSLTLRPTKRLGGKI